MSEPAFEHPGKSRLLQDAKMAADLRSERGRGRKGEHKDQMGRQDLRPGL